MIFNNLMQQIEKKYGEWGIANIPIPDYITQNLKQPLWEWQTQALQYFLAWNDPKFPKTTNKNHLMFNMATGTGKTLLMAGIMLYYYFLGYRKFLFFVNANNVINKTEANFIDTNHKKYLFVENIIIKGNIITIRKVEQFDNSDDLQIKFTTIHKLHNATITPRENEPTLSDLNRDKIILLGDEAHHINASTKRQHNLKLENRNELKQGASDELVEQSWENTIIHQILGKNPEHRLCEFTATIPQDTNVIDKYHDKIIYQYKMTEFYKSGHTKELILLPTGFTITEKKLLALLCNWYRSKIALKNNISDFKPVILFRSKLISDSRNDYQNFQQMIDDLHPQQIKNILEKIQAMQPLGQFAFQQGENRLLQMLEFIQTNKINYDEIVSFIKFEFNPRNVVITNSKDDITKENTDKNIAQKLNNLEDKNNHIRAIFTVNRLTEGWDVLNLFDIVRLYTGRDSFASATGKSGRKAGKTTTQEVQLIGRGIRYYPFKLQSDHIVNKRKYDNDPQNPMRICEELFYISDDDHRYISELKAELREQGINIENRIEKKFDLKPAFKNTELYKNAILWVNDKRGNPRRKNETFQAVFANKTFIPNNGKAYNYEPNTKIKIEGGFHDKIIDANQNQKDKKTIKLNDPADLNSKHLWRSAINIKNAQYDSIFHFDILSKILPIKSIDDFLGVDYLGSLPIYLTTDTNVGEIPNKWLLDEIFLPILDECIMKIRTVSNEFIGSEFRRCDFKDVFGAPKIKMIIDDKDNQELESRLKNFDWFVSDGFDGNTLEREVVQFIISYIDNIKQKFQEVYVLRNEEVYKIYNFTDGRGFQPDFLLFLKNQNGKFHSLQVFIESKGEHISERDKWKQEFLLEITEKYGNGQLYKNENGQYDIIGLPFFEDNNLSEFRKSWNDLLN